MECVLCGRFFADEMVEVKRQNKGSLYQCKMQREVCPSCTSPNASKRRAHWREIPACAMEGAFRLAGEIVRGCLDRYRREYRNAKKELMLGIQDGDEVAEFLYYHSSLQSSYFDTFSLGQLHPLMDWVRRDEDKSSSGKELRAVNRLKQLLEEDN